MSILPTALSSIAHADTTDDHLHTPSVATVVVCLLGQSGPTLTYWAPFFFGFIELSTLPLLVFDFFKQVCFVRHVPPPTRAEPQRVTS